MYLPKMEAGQLASVGVKESCENCKELQMIFDLGHKRTLKADKAWQKEHNKPDVFPDLGTLVDWLMKKAGL